MLGNKPIYGLDSHLKPTCQAAASCRPCKALGTSQTNLLCSRKKQQHEPSHPQWTYCSPQKRTVCVPPSSWWMMREQTVRFWGLQYVHWGCEGSCCCFLRLQSRLVWDVPKALQGRQGMCGSLAGWFQVAIQAVDWFVPDASSMYWWCLRCSHLFLNLPGAVVGKAFGTFDLHGGTQTVHPQFWPPKADCLGSQYGNKPITGGETNLKAHVDCFLRLQSRLVWDVPKALQGRQGMCGSLAGWFQVAIQHQKPTTPHKNDTLNQLDDAPNQSTAWIATWNQPARLPHIPCRPAKPWEHWLCSRKKQVSFLCPQADCLSTMAFDAMVARKQSAFGGYNMSTGGVKAHVAASCGCKAGWFEMFPRLCSRKRWATPPGTYCSPQKRTVCVPCRQHLTKTTP